MLQFKGKTAIESYHHYSAHHILETRREPALTALRQTSLTSNACEPVNEHFSGYRFRGLDEC